MLSLRYSRATPRFETLLQTLRRVPQAECYAFAGGLSVRESFFSRKHSTYAPRSAVLSSK